jgi:hypothetical protein
LRQFYLYRPIIAEKAPAQGIGGARSVLCALRKEWSEAEPRKARFPARRAGNAPVLPAKSLQAELRVLNLATDDFAELQVKSMESSIFAFFLQNAGRKLRILFNLYIYR